MSGNDGTSGEIKFSGPGLQGDADPGHDDQTTAVVLHIKGQSMPVVLHIKKAPFAAPVGSRWLHKDGYVVTVVGPPESVTWAGAGAGFSWPCTGIPPTPEVIRGCDLADAAWWSPAPFPPRPRDEALHDRYVAAAPALAEGARKGLAAVPPMPAPRDKEPIRVGDRFRRIGDDDWAIRLGEEVTVRRIGVYTDALRDRTQWQRLPRCADDCTPVKPCMTKDACPALSETGSERTMWHIHQDVIASAKLELKPPVDPAPLRFSPPELRCASDWACGLARTKR